MKRSMGRLALIFVFGLTFLFGISYLFAGSPRCTAADWVTLDSGASVYRHWGAEQAVSAWLRGGLLERTPQEREIGTLLKAASSKLGIFKSWEPQYDVRASAQSAYAYAVINHDRGAIYLRFLLYRGGGSTLVNGIVLGHGPFAEAVSASPPGR